MTEASENDGEVLLRVPARVMERDDSTGGWVGMSSVDGELATVSLVKSAASAYHLYGQRKSDQFVLFECAIDTDFEYSRVMPTFHYWNSSGRKLGLVFQTAADGRVFDKGMMAAIKDILHEYQASLPSSEYTENDVFMAVNLPYQPEGRRSPSGLSDPGDQSSLHQPKSTIRRAATQPAPAAPLTELKAYKSKEPTNPTLSPYQPLPSPAIAKKYSTTGTTTSSTSALVEPEKDMEKRCTLVCKWCHQRYVECENSRGSCARAPDCANDCVEIVSCVPCARRALEKCMPESCNCESSSRRISWRLLAVISICLPCLWCYPPLKTCHMCAEGCGLCGGKHEPIVTPGLLS